MNVAWNESIGREHSGCSLSLIGGTVIRYSIFTHFQTSGWYHVDWHEKSGREWVKLLLGVRGSCQRPPSGHTCEDKLLGNRRHLIASSFAKGCALGPAREPRRRNLSYRITRKTGTCSVLSKCQAIGAASPYINT